MDYTSKSFGARYLNGKVLALPVIAIILYFVVGPMLLEFGKMPGSARLQDGQKIMHQIAGEKNLRAAGFYDSYPDGKPSDFVNMISDSSHRLWPPTREEELDSRGGVNTGSSSRVLMPEGLVFSPYERQTTDDDEIVFVPDDPNRQLIVRGYSPGAEEVTFEYVWDFPTKAGAVPLY